MMTKLPSFHRTLLRSEGHNLRLIVLSQKGRVLFFAFVPQRCGRRGVTSTALGRGLKQTGRLNFAIEGLAIPA
jgi:hypothetical protein